MSPGPFGLDGRAAIVTGGGGGLGEGICVALAAAGAAVAVADRDLAKAERVAELVGGLALECDVSVVGSVERAVGGLDALDILVNNAAIYPRREWTAITEAEWDEVLAVNLKGYFLCARAAAPALRASGRGRIVNVASITFHLGFPNLLDYVASKGGIIGFTRSLARELGPDGVTVNAIAPGAFRTDAEKIHPNPEEFSRWVLEQQSLKRRGTPEDVGNLVVFLASDAASFITGQTVVIDGGWVMQ